MTVTLADLDLLDIDALTALVAANRADLEAVNPPQRPEWFTPAGQRARVEDILEQSRAGTRRAWTIRLDGAIVGDISISAIARGFLQTGNLGYIVDAAHRGRGVGSAAVSLAVDAAFGEMRLHRLDAGTLTTNIGSQRVLEKCGFRRVGLVERYLFVAGEWRDNYLYERVGPDRIPDLSEPTRRRS